jgi:hypothetical protein
MLNPLLRSALTTLYLPSCMPKIASSTAVVFANYINTTFQESVKALIGIIYIDLLVAFNERFQLGKLFLN